MRKQASTRWSFRWKVAIATELDRASCVFDETSPIFVSNEERLVARRMVEELGRELGSDEPLGTGNLQALVVFEHNCPNNSLPVLWKGSKTLPWTPLFPVPLGLVSSHGQ